MYVAFTTKIKRRAVQLESCPCSVTGRIGRQGIPAATTPAGMSCSTTLPCADDRALPDRHAAADHGVGADPDILLNRNRFRSADAARALLRVNRMPRTAQTDAGRNKSTCPDMDGGGVQNGAVVVDDGEPMSMDVEPVIAVKGRLDKGQRMAAAKQLLENLGALSFSVGAEWLYSQHSCCAFSLSCGGIDRFKPAYPSGSFKIL